MPEISNVVLVTVDCLRADHLPMYGYHRSTTPFLSELAADGVVFERAYAVGPGTSVSFPGIFTSTFPFDYGGYNGLGKARTHVMSVLSAETAATTLGVHSNPYLSHHYGYDRGYDEYVQFETEADDRHPLVQFASETIPDDSALYRLLRGALERVQPVLPASESARGRGERITDAAIERIEGGLSSPFCMWLHYMDVHSPHHPAAEPLERFAGSVEDLGVHNERWRRAARDGSPSGPELESFVDVYDATIATVDRELERLFAALEPLPGYDRTLFVVTADHGEEFGEHGQLGHADPHVHEELTRVPLVLYHPGVAESRSVPATTSLIDIAPTVLDAFGVDPPDDYRGESVLSALEGAAVPATPAFSEVCHTTGGTDVGALDMTTAMIACRTDDAEYIRNYRTGETRGDASLEPMVTDHVDSLYPPTDDRTVQVPAGVEERLADLGYVD